MPQSCDRPSRIRRALRVSAIAAAVALLWAGWWHAPPWPDGGITLANAEEYQFLKITSDGRLLIASRLNPCGTPVPMKGANQFEVYDLATGKRRGTFGDPDGLTEFDCSPD